MSVNEIAVLENKITLMQQYETEAESFKAKAEEIKDSIKKQMSDLGTDEITTPNFVVRFIDVLTNRFDTKKFKEELGDEVYTYYLKQVSSKRFTVSQ